MPSRCTRLQHSHLPPVPCAHCAASVRQRSRVGCSPPSPGSRARLAARSPPRYRVRRGRKLTPGPASPHPLWRTPQPSLSGSPATRLAPSCAQRLPRPLGNHPPCRGHRRLPDPARKACLTGCLQRSTMQAKWHQKIDGIVKDCTGYSRYIAYRSEPARATLLQRAAGARTVPRRPPLRKRSASPGNRVLFWIATNIAIKSSSVISPVRISRHTSVPPSAASHESDPRDTLAIAANRKTGS